MTGTVVQVHELDLSSPVAFLVVAGLALIGGVIPLVPRSARRARRQAARSESVIQPGA